MHTGLFIDITAVRANETARKRGVKGALKCKDRHEYTVGTCSIAMAWMLTTDLGGRHLSLARKLFRGDFRQDSLSIRQDSRRRVLARLLDRGRMGKVCRPLPSLLLVLTTIYQSPLEPHVAEVGTESVSCSPLCWLLNGSYGTSSNALKRPEGQILSKRPAIRAKI